jgi:ribosomal peptide maturation radical SAM protein 1
MDGSRVAGEQVLGLPRLPTDVHRRPVGRRRDWPVALVAMPFITPFRPSLQLGLLKAIALRAGFPTETFHLHLDFAQQIETRVYGPIGEIRGRLFGDWLFSREAFGPRAPDPGYRFVDDFAADLTTQLGEAHLSREQIVELRERTIPTYLDELLETVPWGRFRCVGFTCTFQQSAASFALARRLKARYPDLITIFGGANFEGVMGLELARSVDVIDYAVIGEGDVTFPELLEALFEGRDPASVAGLAFRRGPELITTPSRPPFEGMDMLPTPDYDEYFERAERVGLFPVSGRRTVGIPFESARGCWWGAKHHCTFCGLNGATMTFRAKSPARVTAELSELARRHHDFRFFAVDNILDYRYLQSLMAPLTEAQLDYELFYEVKANLSRQQVKLLRDAGVRQLQPGIESLSSHVLALMRKGITAAQNVNLLRWALYYGVGVMWNLITGFPGETRSDYDEQAALMPHLVHLQAPSSWGRIWMERFSPMFVDRQAFPARTVRPEASYAYIYPADARLEDLAYFFDYELEHTLPPSVHDETIAPAAAAWHRSWAAKTPPTLTFWTAHDYVQIEDLRHPDTPGVYNFEGPLAALYAACSDRPHTAATLRHAVGLDDTDEAVEAACEEFRRRGLMMRDGDRFLSLAVPANRGR